MSAGMLLVIFVSLLGLTVGLPRKMLQWSTRSEERVRFRQTPTLLADKNSSCINAAPYMEKPYPIHYANIRPLSNWTNYKIDELWYKAHYVSGPHMTPYADFKCQYTCNGEPACESFFGYYEDVNTSNEHHQCVLFNAMQVPF
ncbi:hypothetical protein GQ53DRAFT_826026 [Thozetella sp. PMI_491]|nr:hypothetical protein GQ53DRAFT_826026 [Thozetella sp. PMI_491]